MPCGPNKTSFAKLNTATHTIGDTSTPNAGGTTFLVGPKMGSVGAHAINHGSFFWSISGYHVITILTIIKICPTAHNGPRTVFNAPAVGASTPAKVYNNWDGGGLLTSDWIGSKGIAANGHKCMHRTCFETRDIDPLLLIGLR